mmetsp:Transcript_44108/g.70708  ORF Transcript_44108/g.70708 Transcript_44108/m.70708 type:complete len:216 (-) Transcript_44108:424-1071(-)
MRRWSHLLRLSILLNFSNWSNLILMRQDLLFLFQHFLHISHPLLLTNLITILIHTITTIWSRNNRRHIFRALRQWKLPLFEVMLIHKVIRHRSAWSICVIWTGCMRHIIVEKRDSSNIQLNIHDIIFMRSINQLLARNMMIRCAIANMVQRRTKFLVLCLCKPFDHFQGTIRFGRFMDRNPKRCAKMRFLKEKVSIILMHSGAQTISRWLPKRLR